MLIIIRWNTQLNLTHITIISSEFLRFHFHKTALIKQQLGDNSLNLVTLYSCMYVCTYTYVLMFWGFC
jgi:hypothetical protein